MDALIRKETISKFTILAIILSAVIFFASVFFGLIQSNEATLSLKGVLWIFIHNPLYWFLLLLALVLPISIYWIIRHYNREIRNWQEMVEQEESRLQHVNLFTEQLIQDDFEAELNISGKMGLLGKSLLKLRDTLRANKENSQKLRTAEDQRNWIAGGLAKISEILRNNLHDIDQLSFNVIKEVTKYIEAVQGGFYLVDDGDKANRYFNLTAFFAYDRRKFTDQRIKWGDGLIGTCAMEQKLIHLKNVPESYIQVTSGLGEANPNSLLILPMLYENEVYGVLEFASFKSFEQNHITLLEQVAESIASTLSAVKTNIQTARLLEESKAQTQALTSHEEEMRQNMEELQATQEEATRQAQRFIVLEETINQNLIRAEFSDDGRFASANAIFYTMFEYANDQNMHGKHIQELISEDFRTDFNVHWKKLITEGTPFKGYLKHTTRTGKDLWTMSSLSCHKNDSGVIEKIIYLALDATEEINRYQKNDIVSESVDKIGIRFELDIHGNFHEHNDYFVQLLKYSQKDLRTMVIFDMIDPVELDTFSKHWDNIIRGTGFTGIIKIKTSDGSEKWLKGVFNALFNTAHEIYRIVFTGVDITVERWFEVENKTQAETLKKQEKMLRDAEKEVAGKLREARLELQQQFKVTERLKTLNENILEDSPDAIVTTGNDNRIIFFNKAAEHLWRFERQEVLGNDAGMLFPEKLTEENEVVGSFTRPGDFKIVGKKSNTFVIDKKGKEKPVVILLGKIRIDGENSYTAYLQYAE